MTYWITGSAALVALVMAGMTPAAAEARPGGGPDGAGFERLDTDGDGAITEAELAAHRADRFARLDADGDGFVTPEEIAAMMQRDMGPRAERMLERMDRNGDGKLSAAELEPQGRRGDLFTRLDADEDGQITREEFDAMREMARGEGRMGRPFGGPRAQ